MMRSRTGGQAPRSRGAIRPPEGIQATGRRGSRTVWLAAAIALLAVVVTSLPVSARKTIKRRFPPNNDWRPATPLVEGQTLDAATFFARPGGSAEVTIGVVGCQRGFRIDNIAILKKDEFTGNTCGGPCSIEDSDCHSSNATVRVLLFDEGQPPPAEVVVFETFDDGVPQDWILQPPGNYWDSTTTAPRSVVNDGSEICRPEIGSGSLVLEPMTTVTIPLSGLEEDVEYLVHVWWGSADHMFGGEAEGIYFDLPGDDTPPEEDLGPILLVDDTTGDGFNRLFYNDALIDLGVAREIWTTGSSDADEPGATFLRECYDAVVWFSGEDSSGFAGPGVDGEAALGEFLDDGGCLLLTSPEHLRDHQLTAFTELRFGVDDWVDDVGHGQVTGAGPFEGVGSSTLFESLSDQLFSDGTADVAFDGDPGVAALAKETLDYRAAFLGFTLESSDVLPETLQRFLGWCAEGRFTLSVLKDGGGDGTVTSDPAGIDCGLQCSADFFSGTQVALTATPASGSTFAGWSGGGCSGTGVCVVDLNQDTSVTATFEADDVHLQVRRNGNGSGTITSSPAGIDCGGQCSETYPSGTQVTLTATPASGSTFTGWSGGGCSGTDTCVLTLEEDALVTATFSIGPDRTLTVSRVSGNFGRVTSSPAGIDCGSACSQPFPAGAEIILTPTLTPGSKFLGWSGGGCSGIGAGACHLMLNQNTSVDATFILTSDPIMAVTRAGGGSGTVVSAQQGIDCGDVCAAPFASESQITLIATAAAGSTFTGWSGGGCSGTGPCVLTLECDIAVTATFEPAAFRPTLAASLRGSAVQPP